MLLDKLSMVNFRNYESAEVSFKSKINLIYGLNAQGKTNFLEAIYLLCLGRSFRQAKNQDLLKIGSPHFTVEGHIKLDNDLDKVLALQYVKDGKKEISINRKRLAGYTEVFGNFPAVVLSPEDYRITTGAPAERRRFIDILLSQISLSYLMCLQEYQRVLKQRNKILNDIKSGGRVADSTVEPWTEKLVEAGGKIIRDRYEFLSEYTLGLQPIYREYSASKDEISLRVESLASEQDTEMSFRSALMKLGRKERIVGRSLVGPHRDDLMIAINGRDIRAFGSRGEHKTALIAMKLAELQFLREKKDETPILLLDDCFSELDEVREEQVFFSFHEVGQMFLTTPRARGFLSGSNSNDTAAYFVENGGIHAN
jgi:DNA replication and repair protein RecF